MRQGNVDVKSIVEHCKTKGLNGVTENDNGWRASTLWGSEKPGDNSLSISKDGQYKCFKSENSGEIVGLYSHLIGRDYDVARWELKKLGLLPSSYVRIVPSTDKKEIDHNLGDIEKILGSIRMDNDWTEVTKWRGLSTLTIKQSVTMGFLGYVDSYPKLGASYAFICNTPPIEGSDPQTKGVMLRSALPNIEKSDRWRTPGKYPIWAPVWNVNAKNVFFTEGQWDALAMQELVDLFMEKDHAAGYQVLALCGPKNVEKYPEIMEYLQNKNVLFVPDKDEKGEQILAKVSHVMEQVVKDQKLLRVMGDYKDLNDWFKAGITRDQFNMWIEGQDPFRVSNGYIIDSEFRKEHGVKHDAIIEVNDEGEPVEIYVGNKELYSYLDKKYLMDIIDPFPLFRDYVEAAMEAIESPPIFHIQSFLAYEAAMIGRRFKIESGSSNCLYPNHFTLLVGPSGIGKSEAMKMLMGVAARVNRSLFTSESFSAESLIDEFGECPQRMMVSEEFSPWMQSKEGSYRFWAMKNFLLMYDCHRFSEDSPYVMNFRKTSRVEIPNPCLTILSAVTTEQIHNVNPQLLTDGTVGRFFYPIGTHKDSSIPFPKSVNGLVLQRVERFYRQINGTPIRTNVAMSFSPAARSLYVAAFNKQEELMKAIDPSRDAQTYSSRWRVQVQKFCILFEILRPVHDIEEDLVRHELRFKRSDMVISEDSMSAALKLVEVLNRCFIESFIGKFKTAETQSFNSILQGKILSFMKKNSRQDGSGVTRTSLMRFLQEDKRTADAGIESLVEQQRIFQKEIRPTREGKRIRSRPITIYLLAEEKNGATNGNNSGAHKNNGHAKIEIISK